MGLRGWELGLAPSPTPAAHPGSWSVRADRLGQQGRHLAGISGQTCGLEPSQSWEGDQPGVCPWSQVYISPLALSVVTCLPWASISYLWNGVITVHPAWVLFQVQWGKEQEASENIPSASVLVRVSTALSPPWIPLINSHLAARLKWHWDERGGCGLSRFLYIY